jgi:hypothetical protein
VEADETLLEYCENLRGQLKSERSTFESVLRDVDRYVLPDRCQWNTGDDGQGKSDSFSYIIDDYPVQSIRTCSSGLHSGITSPARPWFELDVPDKDMGKVQVVKAWLEACRDRMLAAFAASNLYNVLPVTYGNCAAFGFDALIMDEDDEEVFRFENLPIGSYWFSVNHKRRADCLVREFRMSVRQMVKRFGVEKCSQLVQSAWNRKERETKIEIVHVVCENDRYNPRGIMADEKRYQSIYYEGAHAKTGSPLSVSGYDTFPALCPRWETTGRNSYGQGPGKQIRGHAKALQAYKRTVDKGVAKMTDQPMVAPSSLQGKGVNQVAGGITYYDERATAAPKITPLYDVNAFPVEKIYPLIQDARQQIDRSTFADLFMMISNSDRRQVTAEEIRAKQEEKILQIGPVLENLNDELLDPLIARAFSSMLARGLLPEPPEELQGVTLVVRYVSMMAQVQKMLGLGALDRFLGQIGNIAGLQRDVTDNFDADKVALEYHDMLGVTYRILRDPDKRDAMREQRAQAAQQQAAMEQQSQQAANAKLLSEADTDGQNALTDLIKAQTGI